MAKVMKEEELSIFLHDVSKCCKKCECFKCEELDDCIISHRKFFEDDGVSVIETPSCSFMEKLRLL